MLHALDSGKTGLFFMGYALVVPYWENDKVVLRLVKTGEDWINNFDNETYERMTRLVAKDISRLPDKELEHLLDGLHREANPDAKDEEDEE